MGRAWEIVVDLAAAGAVLAVFGGLVAWAVGSKTRTLCLLCVRRAFRRKRVPTPAPEYPSDDEGTPDAAPVPGVGALQVADVMSSPVFSAHPQTPIRDIARVLFAERIGAIAICDDEWKLVGILTRSDILRTLLNNAPVDLWV